MGDFLSQLPAIFDLVSITFEAVYTGILFNLTPVANSSVVPVSNVDQFSQKNEDSLPDFVFLGKIGSSVIREPLMNFPLGDFLGQWGTLSATNPVALVPDLSTQNTTFLILSSGTSATGFVAERVPHFWAIFQSYRIAPRTAASSSGSRSPA